MNTYPTYHFIYKTTSESGKYYIGRHSTKQLDDGYFGSGKWVRSIKDKTILKREILEFCDESEILEKEKQYLTENVGKPNCMNFNISSVGFSSGELNPAKSVEERKKRSLRSTGDNNPAKRPEVREKMSLAQKGRESTFKGKKMSEQGRKNISKARTGLKISDEGRKKLSESLKLKYDLGLRKPHNKSGWKMSDEARERLSEIAKSRPRIECIYCSGMFTPGILARFHGEKCKRNKILP
jgi:hypothetical protein